MGQKNEGLSLIFFCFFISTISYAQSCDNSFKAKGEIISQKCIGHKLNPLSGIKECKTSIKFKLIDNKCLREDLTIVEDHFMGGYPEGLSGGFRVELNLNEFWEIELCPSNNTFDRCKKGPPGSYIFGTKINP